MKIIKLYLLIILILFTTTLINANNNNIINNNNNETETTTTEPTQHETSIIILLFLIMVFLSVMVVYGVISLNLHYLPESISVIIYGIVIGLLGKFTSIEAVRHLETFNSDMFFLYLLPFIIFETGFSLPKIEFFRNITPILTFAIFGTLLSFLGTGFGLFLFGNWGISQYLPIYDSLIFGSITCATDPVASIAIFKALDVDSKLYMIVLGESILNDAVSIILYESVVGFTSFSDLWVQVLKFFGISIGSIVLGCATALLLSFLLKHLKISKYPAIEILFVFIFSYTSYILANTLHLSGILSSFFCGIAFNQYGYQNLSSESKQNTTQFLRMGSFVCETITFIYIGVSLPLHQFSISFSMLAWSVVFALVFRGMSVFSFTYLMNRFKWTEIPFSIQISIWLAGLRGAISFSLSLDPAYDSPVYGPYVRTQILLLVYFTIFVFGLLTYPTLKALKIKTSDLDQSLDLISKPIVLESRFKIFGTLFYRIDQKYLQPWFTKSHRQNHVYGVGKDNSQQIDEQSDDQHTIEMDKFSQEDSSDEISDKSSDSINTNNNDNDNNNIINTFSLFNIFNSYRQQQQQQNQQHQHHQQDSSTVPTKDPPPQLRTSYSSSSRSSLTPLSVSGPKLGDSINSIVTPVEESLPSSPTSHLLSKEQNEDDNNNNNNL